MEEAVTTLERDLIINDVKYSLTQVENEGLAFNVTLESKTDIVNIKLNDKCKIWGVLKQENTPDFLILDFNGTVGEIDIENKIVRVDL